MRAAAAQQLLCSNQGAQRAEAASNNSGARAAAGANAGCCTLACSLCWQQAGLQPCPCCAVHAVGIAGWRRAGRGRLLRVPAGVGPLQLSCVQSGNLEHSPKRLLPLSAEPGGAAAVSSRPDCCRCDEPRISAGCEATSSLQAVGAA